MNYRQLYGRLGREGKPHKIRAKLDNDRKIKAELDAEVRDYLESYSESVDSINSDYKFTRENQYNN